MHLTMSPLLYEFPRFVIPAEMAERTWLTKRIHRHCTRYFSPIVCLA